MCLRNKNVPENRNAETRTKQMSRPDQAKRYPQPPVHPRSIGNKRMSGQCHRMKRGQHGRMRYQSPTFRLSADDLPERRSATIS
jgi:hypothetical protein